MPSYLEGYEEQYETDPRDAALEWFLDAKYGLFICYGPYSLLQEGEWVMYDKPVSLSEYALLAQDFTAEGFDAEEIVEFAQDCEMEYITFVTRHHGSFCLWDTDETDFNSVDTAAGRDLVAELADACQEAGLGLFLYYSHAIDWRHPHAPNEIITEDGRNIARPPYDEMPNFYAQEGHDLELYLEFMDAQVEELLTDYGPIAGIWLDITPERHEANDLTEEFRTQEFYDHIHDLQPQTLVSHKAEVTGGEDFVSPEIHLEPERLDENLGSDDIQSTATPSGEPITKPIEVNTAMFPAKRHEDDVGGYGLWGYNKTAEGLHKDEHEVWGLIRAARRHDANLVVNTAPRPDGSLDPEDEEVLRSVGDRLRGEGFPGE